ncbi:MAG TPA: prolyl oligopeptidase family serine peptidase [Gemmatimonadaceae bacterium]
MSSRSSVRVAGAVLLFSVFPILVQAQSAPTPGRKPMTISDYSRWRNIEGADLSPDGRWVAYTLRYMNTLPVDSRPALRILNLDTNQDIEVPNAHSASFSADSRWIVYQVDSVPVRGGRGAGAPTTPAADSATAAQGTTGATTSPQAGRGGAAAMTPPRVELRDLASGRTQSWQRMQSGAFNMTATHLLMRRRPPGPAGRGAGPGPAPAPAGPNAARGTDAIVHDLSSGRSLFLGSVGDIAFNRQGDLLAYTVDAQLRDGNGLFLLDLRSGRTHVLDNDTLQYNRLTWSDDGSRIAILKGRPVERMRERSNVLLALSNLRTLVDDPEVTSSTLDPLTAAGFPRGFVVSERAPLSWSEDGRRVFLGIIPQTSAPDTARRRSTDSIADVDVWRTDDERIQSVQMIRAEADRNFTFRQAYEVAEGRYVTLTDSSMREVELALDGRWAVGRDVRAYVSDYKRPAADFYRVNTATGERTLMLKGQLTGQHALGVSPDGRHFLYWKDNRFQAWDLDAGTARTLGNGSNGFVNMQFDYPGPRPSYGVVGYTPDGKNVIVAQRYDLVSIPLDGTGPVRSLTTGTGARRELRFRPVRTEPIDSAAPRRVRSGREIDLTKPVTLSAYGEYTKKAGFYRLENGQLTELVLDDAVFSTPQRAEKADRYLFTRQTFVEFPDLRVSGPAFADARRISDANPQQAEFMWGRRVLFDYRNRDGVRLQGILALPDDYKAGEKRPMIVSFYEKNSQNLHRYTPPSFVTGMGSIPVEALSRGYITMYADIHFRTGSSHTDMLEGVEAATKKVIELGYADPKKIAVHGHSYGGEGAAFIGTRSKMFAAVGMGAGVTDLYSDFSQSWGWSYQVTGGSGANGNEYYLYGQGRWGKSPWDDPELYRSESALAHAPNAVAPFLIMHGTADPTVSFSEGMNFYNALRFNGKKAVMLAYPGEGHGLRGLANRRDLTIRYFQFFDHYLKGAPAPKWMTDGVPFIVKDALKGDPK